MFADPPTQEYDTDQQRNNSRKSYRSSTTPLSSRSTPFQPKVHAMEMPSNKYPILEEPDKTTLIRAKSPPRPILPKKSLTKSWASTQRERYPLHSSLAGKASFQQRGTLHRAEQPASSTAIHWPHAERPPAMSRFPSVLVGGTNPVH
jgi:hypothetical protein